MGAQSLLTSLYRYKAWADGLLLEAMVDLVQAGPASNFDTALRLLNHAHIVDRIFMAHLQGYSHAYDDNEPDELPPLTDLSADIRQTDRAYIDYVAGLSADDLQVPIRFRFTDGQPGRMSREEMLAHVITHGGYHRGEIGRLLPEVAPAASVDVFAGYLHRSEPERRAWRGDIDC
ncbi:DinB family protein [Labrys sp. LIt4]|uniref:DinB family protein n=1 Tax=Labrys sp. LIt4 TaxID=2821355 RepID=UPI001AE0C86E|nr:DinB family protein [Labrys sp. LIt4]MBP0577937.1 DinB family protein [Labrys sp. LIt4]